LATLMEQVVLTVLLVSAFLEPSLWFIVPDLPLFFVLLAAPRRIAPVLISTIAAATLGLLTAAALLHVAPAEMASLIERVPLVTPSMLQQLTSAPDLLERSLVQPWSRIPVKVWLLAAERQAVLAAIVPRLIVVRALRMTMTAAMALACAALFPRLLQRHYWLVVGVVSAVFAAVLWLTLP